MSERDAVLVPREWLDDPDNLAARIRKLIAHHEREGLTRPYHSYWVKTLEEARRRMFAARPDWCIAQREAELRVIEAAQIAMDEPYWSRDLRPLKDALAQLAQSRAIEEKK